MRAPANTNGRASTVIVTNDDDSDRTITLCRDLCLRMLDCRSALAHRIFWIVVDDVTRHANADNRGRFNLDVGAIANLLHCRRESAISALAWLRDAGIIRPVKA